MYANVLLLREPRKEKTTTTSPQKKNAISRLMRDLKEWNEYSDEFPCINACPLESNIFEWHCNICPHSGDYKDIIFHLIIYFDENYPVLAPRVSLLTTFAHPNVFGDWICLDMIKREETNKKYQGWTPAYSVMSILMQLQSFLFEQRRIDQITYHGEKDFAAKRTFNEKDKKHFNDYYLPQIKAFVCNGCKHSYNKPFPMTPSIKELHNIRDNNDNGSVVSSSAGVAGGGAVAVAAAGKNGKNRKNRRNRTRKSNARKNSDCQSETTESTTTTTITTETMSTVKSGKKNKEKNKIDYWQRYIYKDLSDTIFGFFTIDDLMKVRRVNKEFQLLAKNTKILQQDSIRCWFHRCTSIKNGNGNENDCELLCLGFGVKPNYYDDSKSNSLYEQLFASPKREKELTSEIKLKIGSLPMIDGIDITFDLLSSNAFSQFGIRKSVFNDLNFSHFLPLYINKKHGKMAMDKMDEYVYKIFLPNKEYIYGVTPRLHPWIKLITISKAMKSLIVSVMNDSETQAANNKGKISLHYSINVLEAFFKLHHTLLGVYFHHKNELSKLLQHQITLFFQCDKNGNYWYRNKKTIPDFGVFFAYLTLWTNKEGYLWNDIAMELLDETFTRQVKWVCNENHDLVLSHGCTPQARELMHWYACRVSNKLFMFYYFFYKECCQIGEKTPFEKFEEYNNNFGNLNDDTMAIKFQKFVKKVSTSNVNGYKEFFKIIGVKYPGPSNLGKWLIKCLKTSEYRGYHKEYMYNPRRNRRSRDGSNPILTAKQLEKIIAKKEYSHVELLEMKCKKLMQVFGNEAQDIKLALHHFGHIVQKYYLDKHREDCVKYLDSTNMIWKIGESFFNRQFMDDRYEDDYKMADKYSLVCRFLLRAAMKKLIKITNNNKQLTNYNKDRNNECLNYVYYTLSRLLNNNNNNNNNNSGGLAFYEKFGKFRNEKISDEDSLTDHECDKYKTRRYSFEIGDILDGFWEGIWNLERVETILDSKSDESEKSYWFKYFELDLHERDRINKEGCQLIVLQMIWGTPESRNGNRFYLIGDPRSYWTIEAPPFTKSIENWINIKEMQLEFSKNVKKGDFCGMVDGYRLWKCCITDISNNSGKLMLKIKYDSKYKFGKKNMTNVESDGKEEWINIDDERLRPPFMILPNVWEYWRDRYLYCQKPFNSLHFYDIYNEFIRRNGYNVLLTSLDNICKHNTNNIKNEHLRWVLQIVNQLKPFNKHRRLRLIDHEDNKSNSQLLLSKIIASQIVSNQQSRHGINNKKCSRKPPISFGWFM